MVYLSKADTVAGSVALAVALKSTDRKTHPRTSRTRATTCRKTVASESGKRAMLVWTEHFEAFRAEYALAGPLLPAEAPSASRLLPEVAKPLGAGLPPGEE